jgi:hypothetical protein
MAETALGVVSLFGLFSTVIDCFEYVRIAKTFELDFETSQLKLDAAQIRLSRWGEALGVCSNTTTTIPRSDYEHAEKVLKHLGSLFEQAQNKSEIFAQRALQTFEASDLVPPASLVHGGVMAKVCKRMHRSTGTSGIEKAKWAVYKKKDLDSLVEDIVALVDQLERILPMSIKPEDGLQALVKSEVEEILQLARPESEDSQVTPLQIAETIHAAAKGLDPHIEDFIKKAIGQLRADGGASTTAYNINQTMGEVKDNKGIVTAVNHGNQTTYYRDA